MDASEPTPDQTIDETLAETERLRIGLGCLVEASGGIVYGVDRAGLLTFVEQPAALASEIEVPKLIGTHHHTLHAAYSARAARALREPERASAGSTAQSSESTSCVLCAAFVESLASSAECFSGRLEVDEAPAKSGMAFHGRLHAANAREPLPREVGIIALGHPGHSAPAPVVADGTLDVGPAEDAQDARVALARLEEDYSTFVRVASHDLSEPLRAILNFSQILAEDHRSKLDAEAHQLLDHVTGAAARLRALLDGLRSYSRITTRPSPPTRFSARAALDLALESLETEITETGAALTVQPLPDLFADRRQIERLFEVLVSNAIKFRSEAPIRIDLRARQERGYVEFSVTDNGIGIDPGMGDRPFLIFQRLHPRDAYPGIGLGLALARQIVKRHGGTIRFEAAPDRGTTFVFSLRDAAHD